MVETPVSAGLAGENALSPWRLRGLILALCLAVLLLCYRGTVMDLVRVWSNSSTFNHCFLIPLLSLYLVWDKRQALQSLPAGTSTLGLVWMLPNTGLWLAGAFLDIAFFQHAALIGLIIGASWALIGNTAFRLLLFPLFYLYFAVPEGEFLVPKLQDVTAMFSVMLLRLTGMPVFMEGLYITIPSGNFVVAKACSGINYLIATLALATLYAYLSYRSWVRRVLFMLIALVVPILANGIRAYGIIMIAHLSDYRLAMGVDHFIYGWVFFGVVIFALFFIGNLFSDHDGTTPTPRPGPQVHTATQGRVVAMAVAAVVVALLGPAADALTSNRVAGPETVSLPAWQGAAPQPAQVLLGARYVGATQVNTGRYAFQDPPVTLLQGYYARQHSGAELIQSVNRLYDEDTWRTQQAGTAEALPGFQVREVLLRGPTGDYLLWTWYDIHGSRTISQLQSKRLQARARLFGSALGVAGFQVFTPVADIEDPAPARQRLAAFLQAVQPGLGTP